MRPKTHTKHFVIFVALWLNLCNNNNQTYFCIALTFARSLKRYRKTRDLTEVYEKKTKKKKKKEKRKKNLFYPNIIEIF